ncbi:MAG TPA: hypothetical protein VNL16_17880 [Chloroflexota bacterium]|nr:hypothetical protein [Chloroflexota bacterium]
MNLGGKFTRRELLRSLALPAIGGLLLAGCSPSAPVAAPTQAAKSAAAQPTQAASTQATAVPQAASQPAAAPVTLVESSWATDTYGLSREQERVDLYKKTYPDSKITVNLRNVASSGYRQQVLTQLAGGVGPDVFRLSWQDVFPFKEQGQIPALDDKFKSLGKDDWLSSSDAKKDIFDGARYAGKLYGIPMGGDMSNVEVNKSLFKAAGAKDPPITYGAGDWSFDQILEIGQSLTKRSADGTPLQLGIYADAAMGGSGNPFSLVESWGGKTLSDDWSKLLWSEDPGPAAWQWQADLVYKYKVAASAGESQGGAFSYNNGKLAIYPHYVSQLSYHTQDVKDKFDWDQSPWPTQGTNPVRVMFWYSAWVMNAKGKNPDPSFQFLQFVGGPIGTIPGVELGWELPLFTSLDSHYNSRIANLNKNIKPPIDGFEHRISRHYYHQPRWNEAWTKYISPALDDIFANKKTASDALNGITPKVNALLEEGAKLMGTVS